MLYATIIPQAAGLVQRKIGGLAGIPRGCDIFITPTLAGIGSPAALGTYDLATNGSEIPPGGITRLRYRFQGRHHYPPAFSPIPNSHGLAP